MIWFEDGRTGYTRGIAGGGNATSCPGSAIGDGCPATQAVIGSNGGNGIGVALDAQGNMYIADSTNLRIREVSANLRFPAVAVGSSLSQTVKFHSQPGDTFTATALSSPDFTFSAGACSALGDTTQNCTYTAVFKPVVAGLRDAALTVNTANSNPGVFRLAGTGTGAGATLDPAAQILFGKDIWPS